MAKDHNDQPMDNPCPPAEKTAEIERQIDNARSDNRRNIDESQDMSDLLDLLDRLGKDEKK